MVSRFFWNSFARSLQFGEWFFFRIIPRRYSSCYNNKLTLFLNRLFLRLMTTLFFIVRRFYHNAALLLTSRYRSQISVTLAGHFYSHLGENHLLIKNLKINILHNISLLVFIQMYLFISYNIFNFFMLKVKYFN